MCEREVVINHNLRTKLTPREFMWLMGEMPSDLVCITKEGGVAVSSTGKTRQMCISGSDNHLPTPSANS